MPTTNHYIEQTGAELWKRFCLLWATGALAGPTTSSGSSSWREEDCHFYRDEDDYPVLEMVKVSPADTYIYRDVTKTKLSIQQLADYTAENPASRYTAWYCTTVFQNSTNGTNYDATWRDIHKRMRREWIEAMVGTDVESETFHVAEGDQTGPSSSHSGTIIIRKGAIVIHSFAPVSGVVLGSDVSRNYQLQLTGTDAQEEIMELPVWMDVVGSGTILLLFEGNEYHTWIHNQYERFGRWFRHASGRPSLPMPSVLDGGSADLSRIATALEQMVSTDLVVSLDKGRFSASIRGGSVSEE